MKDPQTFKNKSALPALLTSDRTIVWPVQWLRPPCRGVSALGADGGPRVIAGRGFQRLSAVSLAHQVRFPRDSDGATIATAEHKIPPHKYLRVRCRPPRTFSYSCDSVPFLVGNLRRRTQVPR